MNMDEKINQLIGTYKSKRKLMPSGPMKVYSGVISVETVIADLEQLKELSTIEYSRKVKVPRKFDEWYKQIDDTGYNTTKKNCAVHLISRSGWGHQLTGNVSEQAEYDESLRIWVDESKERAVRAVLDGYEIEEEPKWVVKNNKGKYFCIMGFSTNQNKISNVIWRRDSKFEFKTKEAAEAVILLVGGTVEEVNNG